MATADVLNGCSNHRGWSGRTGSVPRAADRLADKEFGRILRAKREETAKVTGSAVSQADIAAVTGVSQGYVSALEVGRRSARNLPGDVLATLLSAYGFRRSEIVQLVRDFGLQYPPSFVDPSSEERVTRLEAVVMEGALSRPATGGIVETVELPAELLSGHPTDSLRVRTIAPTDYASPAARPYAGLGSLVVRSTTLEPQEGDLVIMREAASGVDFLALYDRNVYRRLMGTWLLPFDDTSGDAPPVKVDGRPHVVGVVIGVWRPTRRATP